MNTVTVTGNLTRDPELKFLNGGSAVLSFGLAVNRRQFDKATNEWKETTSFFDVVCWKSLAENAAESLSKGDRVLVTGRLDQRSWQDDQGNNRSKVELVADEVGLSLLFASAKVQPKEEPTYSSEPF